MWKKAIYALIISGLLAVGTNAFAASDADRSAKAALNKDINKVDFMGMDLKTALDLFRDLTKLNVHVNWTPIEADLGISPGTTINLKLRGVQARKVLTLILNEAAQGDKLAFYVENGVVEITTKTISDSKLYTVVYPVEDLVMTQSGSMGGMGGYGGMMGGMGGMGYGGMMGGMGGYGGYGMGGMGGYGGMMGGYGGGMGGYGGGYGGMGRMYSIGDAMVVSRPNANRTGGGYGGGNNYGGNYGGGYGGGMYGGGMGGGMYGGGMMGGGMYGGGMYGGGMMGGGMGDGGYQGAEQLKMLICTTISPDIWKMVFDEEEGQWVKNKNENAKATIQYFDGKLIITAPRSVHEAIGGSVDF